MPIGPILAWAKTWETLVMAQTDDKASKVEVHRHQPPRIVIIGGGFAGIAAARALRRGNAEIVLIDRRITTSSSHCSIRWQPRFSPLRQLPRQFGNSAEKQKNLSVTMAEVTRVDLTSRSLDTISPVVGGKKIAFDYLVLATGMRPSYFGHDEFAKHAPPQDARGRE